MPDAERDEVGGATGGVLERLTAKTETRDDGTEEVTGPRTGIAGPGGGTAEKPVGLVWFGLATPAGTRTERAIFAGDRAAVRAKAVTHALGMLTAAAVDSNRQ